MEGGCPAGFSVKVNQPTDFLVLKIIIKSAFCYPAI